MRKRRRAYADSENPNQPVRLRSLMKVFTVR